MQDLQIGILQIDFTIGDIEGNTSKILQYYTKHNNLDLIVANELSISGYMPFDELYKPHYQKSVKAAVQELANATKNSTTGLIVGDILVEEDTIYNVAYYLKSGKIAQVIKKQKLVNYDVFNEARYFTAGTSDTVNFIELNGFKVGVVVCEDLWYQDIVDKLAKLNLNAVISINASPYEKYKFNNRFNVAQHAALLTKSPVIYSNLVGGVDGVVFDGRSFVVDKNGKQVLEMLLAAEDFQSLSLSKNNEVEIYANNSAVNTTNANKFSYSSEENLAEVYTIIQKGLLDFVTKNNIKGVIIGLSGGIDSALSAAIAADTLGSNKVIGVSIPSVFTSDLSKNIINDLANNLNIELKTLPLDQILSEYIINVTGGSLQYKNNTTEENLQSRIRGSLLMAISNEYTGYVVLCNGNKSELSTGYFTLYGDSCGAFNLLKDLYKKDVYKLAEWRNNNIPSYSKLVQKNVIPSACITREPTAELKFNQKDEDSLLPYKLLDAILEDIIEHNIEYQELINRHAKRDVDLVLKLLKGSEYKRKQSVIGVKLTQKSFGIEWKFPITNKFKE